MAKAKNPWLTRVAIVVSLAAVGVSIYRWRVAKNAPKDLSAGGVELVYEVDVDAAVQQKFGDALDQLVKRMRDAGITVGSVAPAVGSATVVSPNLVEKAPQVALAVRDAGLVQQPSAPGVASDRLMVAFAPDQVARLADAAMQQSARVAHDRIEKLAPVSPTVKQADHKLVIGVPGATPEQLQAIKESLATPGHLELRIADENKLLEAAPLPPGGAVTRGSDVWTAPDGEHRAPVWQAADVASLEAARRQLPPLPGGVEALVEISDPAHPRLRLVARGGVDGVYVMEARSDVQVNTKDPMINMKLDSKGTQLFETLTGENVGRKMAIVVDGKVVSSPVIMTKIGGGAVMLTGGTAGDQASRKHQLDRLVVALNSGALPAPLTLASERLIGPTPEPKS